VHPLVEGRVPVGCDHQVAVDLVIHYLTKKHSAWLLSMSRMSEVHASKCIGTRINESE
jgi:hypothetical protein